MPRELKVGPSGWRVHPTIGAALAAAQPGDTITIAPGVYVGPIVLSKLVHLQAEPNSVTLQARQAHTLVVTQQGHGSSVTGVRISGWDSEATVLVNRAHLLLTDCVVTAVNAQAMSVTHGAVSLESCQLHSAKSNALSADHSAVATAKVGIWAQGGSGISAADSQLNLATTAFADIGMNSLHLTGTSGTIRHLAFRNSVSTEYPVVWATDCNLQFSDCAVAGARSNAFNFSGTTRAAIARCSVDDVTGYGVAVQGNAVVTVTDFASTRIANAAFWVGDRGKLAATNVRTADSAGATLVQEANATVTISGLAARPVEDYGRVVLAIIGGTCEVAESHISDFQGNAVKVDGNASCRLSRVAIDAGEVDFPLIAVASGASFSAEHSRFTGGAESCIDDAGSKLRIVDSTFERSGVGIVAGGTAGTVERCTFLEVAAPIRAVAGMRLTVSDCDIREPDVGIDAWDNAIVRVIGTAITNARTTGAQVSGAKLVATSSTIQDSASHGVEVGDDAIFEARELSITGSGGYGVASELPLDLPSDAITFARNAKGDLSWQGTAATGMPTRSVAELQAELDAMVGLDSVKTKIRSLLNRIAFDQLEADSGRPIVPTGLHAVFTGPPGTGKTTVARLYGELLHAMGLLANGQFSEVGRSDLVVGYIGQTATNTREKFTAALGGVLFIDEAYSLAQTGGSHTDFGEEAINELVPLMENHRHDIAVIVAGYTDQMDEFLDTNPGLKSRFSSVIEFPSYSTDEMMEIIARSIAAQQRVATAEAMCAIRDHFEAVPRDKNFGNGRDARRFLDEVVGAIANRVIASGDMSTQARATIYPSDVEAAIAAL